MGDGHLPLPVWHELAQGTHRPGSGACERDTRRCVLVARLKVCSIDERGAGDGRTCSSWLARGVGNGTQLAWLARNGNDFVDASLVTLRC